MEDGTIYQSEKLPSVIAWYNGRLLVGEGASNLKYTLTKGKNIWFSFKMEGVQEVSLALGHDEPVSLGCPLYSEASAVRDCLVLSSKVIV